MITTGKISTSAIAILEATAGLHRELMVIKQFANAAELFQKATRVTDLSSSALHVQLTGGNLGGALQKATLPPTLASAAAPRRKAEEKRSPGPSSVTANADTLALRNRAGIDALSVKGPWTVATAFSFFYRRLKFHSGPKANDTRSGKGDTEHTPATPSLSDTYARFLRSLSALERASIAAFTPTLIRALDGIASVLDWLTRAARTHSMVSAAIVAIPATALALIGLGGAHRLVLTTLRPFFLRGLRDVLWLLRNLGVTGALRWLGRLFTEVVEISSMLGELSLGWYVVIAAALAVAGYDLYRHWDAVKRLVSRWIVSPHRAVAHWRKWRAGKTTNATALVGNSIAGITATLSSVPHLLNDAAPAMRGLNSTRVVEHAGALARPTATLRAVKRAAAAVAFAAPLMLATAPTGAFAPPPISTGDTARLEAPLSTTRMTQGAIVINYAPNVTIHSEDAADTAALKRRVMEILERHGRELHQVLTREIVRQQRRDFQPRHSHEQG